MSIGVLKKKPLLWLYVAGVVFLLVGAGVWWSKVSVDPERVFWGTVENGMATRGVTIQAEQTNTGTTIHQTLQFSLGATNLSHVLTQLTQQGTTVHNEMIGTPKVDYTRYLSIETDQKRADGGDIDFSPVLGTWAEGPEGMNRLFSQAVLGTALPLGGMGVPIGNLSAEARGQLIEQIRKDAVYQVAFDKVKKRSENGRLLYEYEAAIQPVAYAALMKQFARAVGIHDLDQLDPSTYKGQEALKFRMTIDARARRVVQVAIPEANYKQVYTSYDVPVQIELPKETISTAELQERLSNLQ